MRWRLFCTIAVALSMREMNLSLSQYECVSGKTECPSLLIKNEMHVWCWSVFFVVRWYFHFEIYCAAKIVCTFTQSSYQFHSVDPRSATQFACLSSESYGWMHAAIFTATIVHKQLMISSLLFIETRNDSAQCPQNVYAVILHKANCRLKFTFTT